MKKVLYVEDNVVNISLVQAILEARPHVILLTAMVGSMGIELAQQQHPDLILLDLNLPDMDGEEYLHRLRAIESVARVPVVIISADAMNEQSSRFVQLGVADYITKPFDLCHFEAIIDRLLGDAIDS